MTEPENGHSMACYPDLHAVILAGGSGTRFWPLSREMAPKQLLTLFGDDSLIAETIARIEKRACGGIHVITSEILCDEMASHLAAQTCFLTDDIDVIAEPVARNTAFAVALAAAVVERTDPEAIVVALPSDHTLTDDDAWKDAMSSGYAAAAAGHLTLVGLAPTRPETGYGYIKVGDALEDAPARSVAAFVEKPDLARARIFVMSEDHLWNAGIFVGRARVILDEMDAAGIAARTEDSAESARIAEVARRVAALPRDEWKTAEVRTLIESLPSVSFDRAVLEVSDATAVVPAALEWSDVGSLLALDELAAPDVDGNRLIGRAYDVDSRDITSFSEGRLVATLGLRDTLVIETGDAVLVADKDRAQEVGDLVKALRASGAPEASRSRTSVRPWGSWTLLMESPGFKVKRLRITPHTRLSLQKHESRSEHWIVVSGTATVERDGKHFELATGESTFLPAGTVHRLANKTDAALELIEVAVGDYLGEDDIERLEDDWAR